MTWRGDVAWLYCFTSNLFLFYFFYTREICDIQVDSASAISNNVQLIVFNDDLKISII